jgi:hypothetical protein
MGGRIQAVHHLKISLKEENILFLQHVLFAQVLQCDYAEKYLKRTYVEPNRRFWLQVMSSVQTWTPGARPNIAKHADSFFDPKDGLEMWWEPWSTVEVGGSQ